MRDPITPRRRPGATLLELLMTCALVAMLTAIVLPGTRRLVDRLEVRAAVEELAAACSAARQLAILRGQPATLTVDDVAGTAVVVIGSDTTVRRDLARSFGVAIHATRDAITYTPTGLAYGVSNLSVIVTRGRAVDTLFVSRLGRVRR